MSKQRTITLTGRPPVTIVEDDWPVIASASDRDWDNQYECQANRIWSWWVKVRQHNDGRVLVYAGYTYSSNWQNEREYSARAGRLLANSPDASAICEAIRDVCDEMANTPEVDSDHTARWHTFAADCIADMPAEAI